MPEVQKARLLVAQREDERWPQIVAAMDEDTWEVIPPEDWDAWKRKRAQEFFSEDWTAYDYVEVVISLPVDALRALFDARHMTPTNIESGT